MALSLTIRRLLGNQPAELPVFHPIALRLQHILADEDFTIEEVVSTANEDQALATRILGFANSPMYAGRTKVETIRDAVVRMGAQMVAGLAMAASQAASHASTNPVINSFMKELWQHSHACAVGARWVAEQTGNRHLVAQAYMGALLHDVGKLYLLKAVERLAKMGVAQSAMERELMLEIFAEMHVEQGLRVMEHWNLPQVYRDVVGNHHLPVVDTDDTVLIIVRLVNSLSRSAGISLSSQPPPHSPHEVPEVALLALAPADVDDLLGVLEESADLDS